MLVNCCPSPKRPGKNKNKYKNINININIKKRENNIILPNLNFSSHLPPSPLPPSPPQVFDIIRASPDNKKVAALTNHKNNASIFIFSLKEGKLLDTIKEVHGAKGGADGVGEGGGGRGEVGDVCGEGGEGLED